MSMDYCIHKSMKKFNNEISNSKSRKAGFRIATMLEYILIN